MNRFIGILICFQTFVSIGQSTAENASKFQKELEKAHQYMKTNLFGEAIFSIDRAIKIAQTNDQKVKASTVKAEFLRSTGDLDLALEAIWSVAPSTIKNASTTNRLTRLGRLAAIHQEYGKYADNSPSDSVLFYIRAALSLANEHPKKHQLEIASLHNELGLYVYRRGNTPGARKDYKIACSIYSKEKRYEHLVTPLSNWLELESCAHQMKVADSLARSLEQLIEGKNWHNLNIIAYTQLALYARVKGDKFAEMNYEVKLNQNAHALLKISNSEKMMELRQLYEHDKLERRIETQRLQSEKNALQLEKSNKNRRELFYYLIAAVIIGIAVVLLLIRERRIKTQMNQMNIALNEANERYQLLVVESNHRIKNNLQMITAMLEYTSKGIEPTNKKVIYSISSKINTISALHKFLYVDIHDEFIPVSNYFSELIKLYRGISPANFQVDIQVGKVQIRSERIVYFGLIFNEMISNTLEHSPKTIDQIQMRIDPIEGGFRFKYSDASMHSKTSKTGMGTELIRNLILRVGGTNFELDQQTGRYQFDFTTEQ